MIIHSNNGTKSPFRIRWSVSQEKDHITCKNEKKIEIIIIMMIMKNLPGEELRYLEKCKERRYAIITAFK